MELLGIGENTELRAIAGKYRLPTANSITPFPKYLCLLLRHPSSSSCVCKEPHQSPFGVLVFDGCSVCGENILSDAL